MSLPTPFLSAVVTFKWHDTKKKTLTFYHSKPLETLKGGCRRRLAPCLRMCRTAAETLNQCNVSDRRWKRAKNLQRRKRRKVECSPEGWTACYWKVWGWYLLGAFESSWPPFILIYNFWRLRIFSSKDLGMLPPCCATANACVTKTVAQKQGSHPPLWYANSENRSHMHMIIIIGASFLCGAFIMNRLMLFVLVYTFCCKWAIMWEPVMMLFKLSQRYKWI